MNADLHTVSLREREVQDEVARLEERLAAMKGELSELATARRVLERLSGGGGSESGTGHQPQPSPPSRVEGGTGMTVPEMIFEALSDASQRGLPGLAPKDVRAYIRDTHGRDIKAQANTVMSRLWRHKGALDKDEATGLFSLPSKDKAPDANAAEQTSEAFNFNHEHDREAGRGGGT